MDPCRTCHALPGTTIGLGTRTEPKDDTARAPSINATKVGQGQGLPNVAVISHHRLAVGNSFYKRNPNSWPIPSVLAYDTILNILYTNKMHTASGPSDVYEEVASNTTVRGVIIWSQQPNLNDRSPFCYKAPYFNELELLTCINNLKAIWRYAVKLKLDGPRF